VRLLAARRPPHRSISLRERRLGRGASSAIGLEKSGSGWAGARGFIGGWLAAARNDKAMRGKGKLVGGQRWVGFCWGVGVS